MTWLQNPDGTESHSGCGRFHIYLLPQGFVCMDVGAAPVAVSGPYLTLADACRWADRLASRRNAA